MSSFSALNVGARAIQAAQRGLDVTGQNISNVATPGYSRQRVDQVAVGGPTVPAIWSKYDGAGGGVDVVGVSRIRDEFLEARARTAHSQLGNLQENQKAREAIERTIGEPSATGLQAQLADFWNAWGKISNNPVAEEPRKLTLERAQGVANQLNRMSNQLTTQWGDTRTELDANVLDLNTMAADVARFNKAIRNNTVNGLPANELADQRDALVEKITTLTGGKATLAEDGMVNVEIGGVKLVDGVFNRTIAVHNTGDTAGGPATYDSMLAAGGTSATTFTWEAGTVNDPSTVGAPMTMGFGTLSAQVDNLDTTISGYVKQLDDIAGKLATTVNTQQAAGYTIDGNVGSALFVSSDGGPIRAGTLVVDPAVTSKSLAMSSTNPTTGTLNGDNAVKMADNLGAAGGADETFRALVVQLGVETQGVNRNVDVAKGVVSTADDARDSVSGVSLDEEMTNLITYQHAYSAASKYISVIDSTIESLLNIVR